MKKQVDAAHYTSDAYIFPGRWASYYYQLKEVLSLKPQSVMEIGVGDKVFGSYLKNNTTITYTSADVAEDVHPDIVASVDNLPKDKGSYDVVCAFEVLEHIPFEKVPQALEGMAHSSKRYVVISVPHFGPALMFLLKIPLMPLLRCAYKVPWMRPHTFNGQHYWELGKKGYSPKRMRTLLQKYFIIKKEFVPFENQYHHFYVLEKK